MIHELVYTSVPRGLRSGSTGFCTVACNQTIPGGLAERLESLSGYRHFSSQHSSEKQKSPVNFAHYHLRIGSVRYHVLSRICDAGVDHTQRTNKFAHHLVLERDDAMQLQRQGVTPADVLATPGLFLDRWNEAPRHLAPRTQLTAKGRPLSPCQAWQRVTGDAGWAGHLATSVAGERREACTVVCPLGLDLLTLIGESARLLTSESLAWEATFSTYFTGLAPDVDCLWRCVIDSTPEGLAARRATHLRVIDLGSKLPPAPAHALVNAARTGTAPVAATRDAAAPRRSATPAAGFSMPPTSGSVYENYPPEFTLPTSSYTISNAPAPQRPLPQAGHPNDEFFISAETRRSSGKPSWEWIAGGVAAILIASLGSYYFGLSQGTERVAHLTVVDRESKELAKPVVSSPIPPAAAAKEPPAVDKVPSTSDKAAPAADNAATAADKAAPPAAASVSPTADKESTTAVIAPTSTPNTQSSKMNPGVQESDSPSKMASESSTGKNNNPPVLLPTTGRPEVKPSTVPVNGNRIFSELIEKNKRRGYLDTLPLFDTDKQKGEKQAETVLFTLDLPEGAEVKFSLAPTENPHYKDIAKGISIKPAAKPNQSLVHYLSPAETTNDLATIGLRNDGKVTFQWLVIPGTPSELRSRVRFCSLSVEVSNDFGEPVTPQHFTIPLRNQEPFTIVRKINLNTDPKELTIDPRTFSPESPPELPVNGKVKFEVVAEYKRLDVSAVISVLTGEPDVFKGEFGGKTKPHAWRFVGIDIVDVNVGANLNAQNKLVIKQQVRWKQYGEKQQEIPFSYEGNELRGKYNDAKEADKMRPVAQKTGSSAMPFELVKRTLDVFGSDTNSYITVTLKYP